MIYFGVKFYRKLNMPNRWPWVMGYSFAIVGISEAAFFLTKHPESLVGLHVEILLPAFILGCTLRTSTNKDSKGKVLIPGEDRAGLYSEEFVGLLISGVFMLFVGLSMPSAFGENAVIKSSIGTGMLVFHVIMVTLLSNIGKMFVCFCYRKEASLKERLAVAVAMFPRGEVGAGVLAVSLSYGINGPYVTVAFMSLALNLVLTGVFIFIVKKLLSSNKKISSKEVV